MHNHISVFRVSVSTRVEVNRLPEKFVMRAAKRLHARGGEPIRPLIEAAEDEASPRAWR